jgi:hypothetical protein
MKEISVNKSKEKIIETIRLIANELQLEISEINDNSVIMYFNGNLLSFGNKIIIDIQKINSSEYTIKINSISDFPLQIIDWGMNKKLETDIMKKLIKELK